LEDKLNLRNNFFAGKWRYIFLVSGIAILAAFFSSCSTQMGLKVGDDAPEFSLQSSDGQLVSLKDYKGQPVLLYFHMAVG